MDRYRMLYKKKFKDILIVIFLLSLHSLQASAQQDGRHTFKYPKEFFDNGSAAVDFDPSIHNKIGILMKNHTNISLPEITSMIFNTSPFDRYKQFFYFRIEEELIEDMANNNRLSTRAYDYSGRPISGGLPMSEGHGAFNLIFLKFGSNEVIQCSCKGVTVQTPRGNFSFVGEDSILHEIGHAFAGLADEYSHPAASDFAAANIDNRNRPNLKWSGLVEQRFLQNSRIKRIELINGIDQGRFLIPSNNCFMNNHNNPQDDRYCPVCQLAIIGRISQLAGATLPWK